IFFFQAEDGIRYRNVTGVQTCALPILPTEGKLPKNLSLKSLTPEIENIMIYGKKADLDEISEITSDSIDLSKINESTEMTVDLDVPDHISISQKKVKVKVELEEK